MRLEHEDTELAYLCMAAPKSPRMTGMICTMPVRSNSLTCRFLRFSCGKKTSVDSSPYDDLAFAIAGVDARPDSVG